MVNALATKDIFNLRQVYWGVTPSKVKKYMYHYYLYNFLALASEKVPNQWGT